jgi:hypothetical protein
VTRRTPTAAPRLIGYIETPAGRVAFAEVTDGNGGTQYRSPAGRCFKRSVALASPHWTAETWPRFWPRRADGGLPDHTPAWMTRGLPKRSTP